MLRLDQRSLGVEQGALVMFSHYENGGPMWTGSGVRELRRDVAFSQPFLSAPAVMVGLAMWDLDTAANARLDLYAEDVTAAGFVIVFRTWGDSRVARVRATWTALGALADADDWSDL